MPPKKKPCNFFNSPGGCRRGDQCIFSHEITTGGSTPQSSKGKAPQRPNFSELTSPRGTCRVYYNGYYCKNSMDCRFRHERPGPSGSDVGRNPPVPTIDSIAPFLTASGLAKINQAGSDAFFEVKQSLSLADAQRNIRMFLHNDFKFTKASEVYGFVKILESVKTDTWSAEDEQIFLSSISNGNGPNLIAAILAWPKVSSKLSNYSDTLSFQRGYLPLLKYLTSDSVLKSNLTHVVNGLMTIVLQNFESFAESIETCLEDAMARKTFRDPMRMTEKGPSGSQIFACLTYLLFECLKRFKNAHATYPRMGPLVRKLQQWFASWSEQATQVPSPFNDPLITEADAGHRKHVIDHLEGKVRQLVAIIDREEGRIKSKADNNASAPLAINGHSKMNEGVVAMLRTTHEGPGHFRPEGPRHDNDFADVSEIRIAPTHQELVCRIPPFLPANFYEAPHHLDVSGMARLLDIQFRLLREELTAPLRKAIQMCIDDLDAPAQKKTRLAELLAQGGGKYRGYSDGQESMLFNIYTGAWFTNLVPDRQGLSTQMSVDTPQGRARHVQSNVRVRFWEGASGKRLLQGGLIALIWKQAGSTSVHLGTITNPLKDITECARSNAKHVPIRVAFFDASVQLRILNSLKQKDLHPGEVRFLVESPVMYEAIRPFLETLKALPETIPFDQYLVLKPEGRTAMHVTPPKYATVPGFRFQLASLFPAEAEVADLQLDASNPNSIEFCREELRRSRLDPSQADAVVDTLTREVALIQGPPGTGKSYTGVELLRVLIGNKIGPILMIAFTNHALDHLLNSVLDAGITTKIVRLGSRSADERMSQYSMETMERVVDNENIRRIFAKHYRALKQAQNNMRELLVDFTNAPVSATDVLEHLEFQYLELYDQFDMPPNWITALLAMSEEGGRFQKVTGKGKKDLMDDPRVAFWLDGEDLDFLTTCHNWKPRPQPTALPSARNQFALLAEEDASSDEDVEDLAKELDDMDMESLDSSDEEMWEQWEEPAQNEGQVPNAAPEPAPEPTPEAHTAQDTQDLEGHSQPSDQIQASDFKNPAMFLHSMGLEDVPTVPTSNRPLQELSNTADLNIWRLSKIERRTLYHSWADEFRVKQHDQHIFEFGNLRNVLDDALTEEANARDETRRQLLKNIDIIGCTTTGAAKLTSLLKGIEPKVMLVEEAGQVLEAHVLGTLVTSVEHLILIGDPLQLRPTLNNYSLSVDSRRGSMLYKFDRSLMERLSSSGFPMSQINVQRRMRPTISSLIRKTLYPQLVDNERVLEYPNVRGFSKNVYFFTHQNRENGGDDSSSKYNEFEVDMIKDLVLYLLRQGVYSREGDIVVLCAYLGQLARVRDALSKEIAVVIDERDQAGLADLENENALEDEPVPERVQVSRRVKIRTIDNFQGEEAKVVILSLVRNNGASAENMGEDSRIGFLKSVNRANVGLSRAMEGLYILGNADQLSRHSEMWQQIIEELANNESIGNALPVQCHHHPNTVEYVSKPGQLARFAPDGGCLQPCDFRLPCGHMCPYKCHPDDRNHVSVECTQPCRRLCSRQHPCKKRCSADCGKCTYVIPNVELPCGHVKDFVPCHLVDQLDAVECRTVVTKQFADCEHSVEAECATDISLVPCNSPCDGVMTCCGRTCSARCGTCKTFNNDTTDDGQILRTQHVTHPCQTTLYCGHACGKDCSLNHTHNRECREPCRQRCAHAICKLPCSKPCAPCQEQCTWKCPHDACPVPCGSACARLPCDIRCNNQLSCGHQCPSVCGEDCSIQRCPRCFPSQDPVDLVMFTTLEDINPEAEALDELLITIPNCRHTFTVETLDGICNIDDYYERPFRGGEPCGPWMALKNPPPGLQSPPSCPTCRAAITSSRYGRIFKRAHLDILERDVASSMSKSLANIHTLMARWNVAVISEGVLAQARNVKVNRKLPDDKRLRGAQFKLLKVSRDVPFQPEALDANNRLLYGLSPDVCKEWNKVASPILTAYRLAIDVVTTRSAHTKAWESSVSYLHESEMKRALLRPEASFVASAEQALMRARRLAGPAPLSDSRFHVEAIWTSLDIRFTLATLAQAWLEGATSSGTYPVAERKLWAAYGLFILATAQSDASLAYDIAEKSNSRRRMTRSTYWMMRADLEHFRFRVEVVTKSGWLKDADNQTKLAAEALEKGEIASNTIAQTVDDHNRALRAGRDEAQWLDENFLKLAHTIADEWKSIERSVSARTRYEPVSVAEMVDIVKAFNFSHTGHFYQCAQGHPFVIGECGGAMQASRCPECGSPIGGSSHTLDPSNSRAMQLENLAAQAGAQRNPWAWGGM